MIIDFDTARAMVGGSIGLARFVVFLNYVVLLVVLLAAMGALSKYTSGRQ